MSADVAKALAIVATGMRPPEHLIMHRADIDRLVSEGTLFPHAPGVWRTANYFRAGRYQQGTLVSEVPVEVVGCSAECCDDCRCEDDCCACRI